MGRVVEDGKPGTEGSDAIGDGVVHAIEALSDRLVEDNGDFGHGLNGTALARSENHLKCCKLAN